MTLRELWDRGELTVGGWCVIPRCLSARRRGRVLDTLRGMKQEVAKTGH